jgi:hypothetical protein
MNNSRIRQDDAGHLFQHSHVEIAVAQSQSIPSNEEINQISQQAYVCEDEEKKRAYERLLQPMLKDSRLVAEGRRCSYHSYK